MNSDNKKSKNYRDLLLLLSPYRALMILSILSSLVITALTLLIPIYAGKAIDLMRGNIDMEKILRILMIMGAAVAVTAALQWFMNVVSNRIVFHISRDIRQRAFKKLHTLPLSFVDSRPHGDLLNRLISDIEQLSDGLLMGFNQALRSCATLLGALLFMLHLNRWMTLTVICLTPISLLIARFITSRIYSMYQLQANTRAEQTAYIDEIVTNQKIVRAFSQEDNTMAKFDEIGSRLKEYSKKAIFYSSLVNPSTRFINSMIYALIALIGSFQVISGNLTIGAMSSFLAYTNQYAKPFNEIAGIFSELQNAFVCSCRVFDLINEASQSEDGDRQLCSVCGDVDIKSVSFSYDKKASLIKDFNLSVTGGERIAIVGPTGCGKTTLINLLMRFYDVDLGGIYLDGHDIRDISRTNLRTCYGMVLQETWIRYASVRDNISLGKPDASLDEIIEAARAVHAHDFIMRLPKGYDTMLDSSSGLSQGQKQLICIARIMLLHPPLLILDEATSQIDVSTEQKIQDAFARLMRGHTSFIVAHRLSTIRDADLILVMRGGQVVEQGKHKELLQKNGFYTQLCKAQEKFVTIHALTE